MKPFFERPWRPTAKGAATTVLTIALAAVVAFVAATPGNPARDNAALAPFEPITIQRIDLPPTISEASSPVFTADGDHLLFFSALQLWEVGLDGQAPTCLSCGLPNLPTLSPSEQMGFATPFPDDKRVFFGAANSAAVLECGPTVQRCLQRRILPVDLSGARPGGGGSGPGGADSGPSVDLGGGVAPKLAPDGTHLAFSDIRSDAVELMVLATLTRTDHGYVTSDPRVLNPTAPTSPQDTDPTHWSDAAGLFEFKSFADGGADATYAQVGGPGMNNPDVWQLDLETGARTRLTSYPDWDEDNAPSPDGRSIVVESDRGMHRVDRLGALLPVRDFIDDPESAIFAAYLVGAGGNSPDIAALRQCDLQPWLLPAAGDRGGTLMGEPLLPYTGGDVHAANNVSGYPQWSPDGTQIALNTQSYTTNRSAPYLLVAHLSSRTPTRPDTVVSSQPGPWAPAPAQYHGPLGGTNHVVLQGKDGGTVTVDYQNPKGVFAGMDKATYRDYRDSTGETVNGTYAIANPNLATGPVTIDAELTVNGRHTGHLRQHLVFSGLQATPSVTVSGTSDVDYDGTTLMGVPAAPRACPDALPRPPQLSLTPALVGSGRDRHVAVHVTASIPDAGLDERGTDTRPVRAAAVSQLGTTALTDAAGDARLPLPPNVEGPLFISVTAGDTLGTAQTTIDTGGGSR